MENVRHVTMLWNIDSLRYFQNAMSSVFQYVDN